MAKRKKVKIFEELKESLESALAYERGEKVNLRVTEIPAPPRRMTPQEIRQIRRSLNASQALFASLLNVSPQAVRSWEQGLRRPHNAALKLLALAKKNPRLLLCA
ncbi:MAG: helix-turn-helix domain-containing protein [Acidobacteria bacterium]|nr:helix-turn-helix domain-containing protein [Acidobacteriota bacterium]